MFFHLVEGFVHALEARAEACAAILWSIHFFSLSTHLPTQYPAMNGAMNSIIKIVKVKNRSM
jgi:hypothetical protein